MNIIDELKSKNALGSIMFHIEPFLSNKQSITQVYKDEYWKNYALLPPLPGAKDIPLLVENIQVLEKEISWTPQPSLKGIGLYEKKEEKWHFIKLVLPHEKKITLEKGKYAITSVSRSGLESKAYSFEIL